MDFGNLSMSKMSTPLPGRRAKQRINSKARNIPPMLLKAAKRREELIASERKIITIDEEEMGESNDDSIEIIRCMDRKADKRQRQVQEFTRKKRRSFIQMPKDVKTLTKAKRRLSRGRGESRMMNMSRNDGYRFNPTVRPVFNFGHQVSFTARAKRPIGNVLQNFYF